jgi:hypothetical protein
LYSCPTRDKSRGNSIKNNGLVITGLFLFVVNGVINLIGAVLCFKRNRHCGLIGFILGISLVLWIILQVFFIGFISFLQPVIFIVANIEMILSLIINKNNKES